MIFFLTSGFPVISFSNASMTLFAVIFPASSPGRREVRLIRSVSSSPAAISQGFSKMIFDFSHQLEFLEIGLVRILRQAIFENRLIVMAVYQVVCCP